MATTNQNGPQLFRQALKRGMLCSLSPEMVADCCGPGKCLVGPGVFDGISTKVASIVGFDFLYLAGSGATGSVVGQPDLSVMTATEFAKLGAAMTQNTDLPVIADADTGFGGPLNTRRTIQMYEHAGLAGCHIADQVFPKRCGQLEGQEVVGLQEFLERIRSAVEARVDPNFVIIARTDVRQAESFGGKDASGAAFQEGLRRLKAAIAAGADMAFMKSPRTQEECKSLVRELAPHPVLVSVLPDSLTGNLTTADCQRLGFAAAVYPCTGSIPAMLAMQDSYHGLKHEGSDLKYCKGDKIGQFFQQLGLQEAMDFDARIAQFSQAYAEQTGSDQPDS